VKKLNGTQNRSRVRFPVCVSNTHTSQGIGHPGGCGKDSHVCYEKASDIVKRDKNE